MPNGEVWSVNPCWEINGATGSPVSPGQAQTIANAIAALSPNTDVRAAWAATTTWNSVRVESRSLTGILETQAEAVRAVPSPGSGTSVHPNQTSIVLSLLTPGVGPSARGRLYWPATGQLLQTSDYRISATLQGLLLTGLKAFLLNIEAAIVATLPNANLTVWSRKTANYHDVNQLRLGNVLDTQRRRRDTLLESYVAGPFP